MDGWAERLARAFSAPTVEKVRGHDMVKLRNFLQLDNDDWEFSDRDLLHVHYTTIETRITARISCDRNIFFIYRKKAHYPDVIIGLGVEPDNVHSYISIEGLAELRKLAADMASSSIFAELNLTYNF